MKKILKKVAATILAASMVIGMTACGTGGGGSSTQGGTSSNKSGKIKIGVSIGNEFVKMIFVSFLNSNIYLLKKRLTSRVGIFLETPYSKASSHFPIASH